MSGRVTGSARAHSTLASVSGTGVSGTFSPSVSGVRSDVARVEEDRPRLGGTTVDTDQVMVQVSSQSMARPVRLASARSRPVSAFAPRTVSSAIPEEANVVNLENVQVTFVPTARPVRRPVPTLDEVRPEPTVVVAKNISPPVEINRPSVKPEVDVAKPVDPKEGMTDLEIFRTQGFKTHAEGRGKNFVFIIDRSASMSQDNRLSKAKQALARTLEKLGPDENYYIYFFSDNTVKMEERRLLAATPGNISNTSRWVDSMSPVGFTNPRDALVDAFGKLKPSTIWLLSDGKFSSFKHVKKGNKRRVVGLTSVLKVIQKLNGAGNVRINTIGFAAHQNQVDGSLKNIAGENGGTYKFIRTDEK
jgi:hypothetical protein